ncbi:BON domain-containing protein [Flavobacterium sp.]|uniref:BON domain-containing protein n=1 Tax=Flavobacterium sp. TaxID=239 RepID=UPI002622BECC|nr:BON domain-containing protein [Flavobacterium sp.]
MKTDEIITQHIMHGLKWGHLFENCNIAVSAVDGNINLSGIVDSYTKKSKAENITWTIANVKSVINKIEVVVNPWEQKKDIDIKAEVLTLFKWNWNTLNDTIKVKVLNGWVILTGAVEWNYQKEAAKEAVINLIGVKGVTNAIEIKIKSSDKINPITVLHALQNHLDLDAKNITIEIEDAKITLKGSVASWYQKETAGRIAWKAHGVVSVANELSIEHLI